MANLTEICNAFLISDNCFSINELKLVNDLSHALCSLPLFLCVGCDRRKKPGSAGLCTDMQLFDKIFVYRFKT